MYFVFHAFDGPEGARLRAENYFGHNAHLDSAAEQNVKITVAGPLLADDGTTPVGSMIVIEAPDRPTAEAFFHKDPFYRVGLWADSTVTAFGRKRG